MLRLDSTPILQSSRRFTPSQCSFRLLLLFNNSTMHSSPTWLATSVNPPFCLSTPFCLAFVALLCLCCFSTSPISIPMIMFLTLPADLLPFDPCPSPSCPVWCLPMLHVFLLVGFSEISLPKRQKKREVGREGVEATKKSETEQLEPLTNNHTNISNSLILPNTLSHAIQF